MVWGPVGRRVVGEANGPPVQAGAMAALANSLPSLRTVALTVGLMWRISEPEAGLGQAISVSVASVCTASNGPNRRRTHRRGCRRSTSSARTGQGGRVHLVVSARVVSTELRIAYDGPREDRLLPRRARRRPQTFPRRRSGRLAEPVGAHRGQATAGVRAVARRFSPEEQPLAFSSHRPDVVARVERYLGSIGRDGRTEIVRGVSREILLVRFLW